MGWTFWTYKRMETRASMRSFDKPTFWDELIAYQQMPSDPFSKQKEPGPPVEHVRAALEGVLRNARFDKTRVNAGYLQALGLTP